MSVANGLFHGQTVSLNLTWQDVVISLRGTPVPMNRQAVARVTIYRATGRAREERELFAEVDWGFRRQARGFVAAVLGREKPLAPAEDCLNDVEILEDVMRKATFGD